MTVKNDEHNLELLLSRGVPETPGLSSEVLQYVQWDPDLRRHVEVDPMVALEAECTNLRARLASLEEMANLIRAERAKLPNG